MSEQEKTAGPAVEEGMTYVEKLDFRRQEQEYTLEKLRVQSEASARTAKSRVSEARQETVRNVGLALAGVLALAVILYAITFWTMLGPESSGPSENERREQACLKSGGGWVPKDLLSSSSQGLCVFPGKVVE